MLEEKSDALCSPLGYPFVVLKHKKFRREFPETTRKGLKTMNVWHDLVAEVMNILGSPYDVDKEMKVGFVLREGVAAMYIVHGKTGIRAIMLNPKGIRLGDPLKSLLPRLVYRLVEEIVHAGGMGVHDERLHTETFSRFDFLMKEHYDRLEKVVIAALDKKV
jgi:hypothetical protein